MFALLSMGILLADQRQRAIYIVGIQNLLNTPMILVSQIVLIVQGRDWRGWNRALIINTDRAKVPITRFKSKTGGIAAKRKLEEMLKSCQILMVVPKWTKS
jgi:hypothetical protein